MRPGTRPVCASQPNRAFRGCIKDCAVNSARPTAQRERSRMHAPQRSRSAPACTRSLWFDQVPFCLPADPRERCRCSAPSYPAT